MMSKYTESFNNILAEIDTPHFSCLYDIDDYKHDWKVIQEAIEKAEKYDALISSVLWKDGRTRITWFNRIRNQEDWLDLLGYLSETEYQHEEECLRLVKHLDRQILLWGLYALKDEIKRYSEEYNKQ